MQQIITEIADLIDAGQRVFFNMESQEILSHPDPAHHAFNSEYDYLIEEVLDIIELAPEKFIQISTPETHVTYRYMEDFAATVSDDRLRFRLFDALNSKKPFRYFRNALEEDEEIAEDWNDFRIQRLEEWALESLEKGIAK